MKKIKKQYLHLELDENRNIKIDSSSISEEDLAYLLAISIYKLSEITNIPNLNDIVYNSHIITKNISL